MTKIKKNKNKFVFIVCSIFICICSIISLLPLKDNNISVKADTSTSTYDFIGSDLYIPNLGINGLSSSSNFNHFTSYLSREFRFSVSLDYSDTIHNITINTTFNSFSQNPANRSFITWTTGSSSISDRVISIYAGENNSPGITQFYDYGYKQFDLYGWTSADAGYSIYSSLFVELVYTGDLSYEFLYNVKFGDVVSIELGNYQNKSPNVVKGDLANITGGYYNYVSYIFSSEYRLNFVFPTTYSYMNSATYFPYSYFQTRTYDVPNTNSNEYKNGYDSGYSNGYNVGKDDGYNIGYDEGYGIGEGIGFNNGYSDGVESANDYTFLGLLSAVIDAPVSYVRSLFDFNLLGVNLQGFLFGLFTLCIIITIVKLCLGGK